MTTFIYYHEHSIIVVKKQNCLENYRKGGDKEIGYLGVNNQYFPYCLFYYKTIICTIRSA